MSWREVERALEQGLAEKVFSAASLLVGRRGDVLFQRTLGKVSDAPEAMEAINDSVFDLASLTKPLATTLACLGLIEVGLLNLEAPVSRWLDLPDDKAEITPAHLLTHTSGLPAWRPYYRELEGLTWAGRRRRLAELVAEEPLEFRPGEKTLYSDLGFMLLQQIVEEIAQVSLAEYVIMNFFQPLFIHDLGFVVLPDGPGPARDRFVASEHCPWRGKLLQGEASDENAWATGGIAGQAGLFGSAPSVFKVMDWLAASARGGAVPRMLSPHTAGLIYERPIPGQPRTLGFDVPSGDHPAAGRLAGPGVIGHLGFVGTSLWHRKDDGLIVILLTNRTIFGRDNDKIAEFRPLIHDLVAEALGE